MSDVLTVSRARDLFLYDDARGVLVRRVRQGRHQAGSIVTSVRADGYGQVGIDGRRYMTHRVIWLIVAGDWPVNLVDHVNGDRSDNRCANLRLATKTTNAQNLKSGHSDGATGLLGVSFIRGRKSKPFRSEIRVEGDQVYLGTFPTAEAAHEAYLAAKRQLHKGNTL
jgi:hypothetical protein